MNRKVAVAVGIVLIVIVGLFFVFSNSSVSENISPILDKISPISIVKYSDDNSTIVITKNNIDKTASIKMELFMEENELKNEFMDMTEFMTTISCGLMQMAFFNETALEEFNQAIQEWNEMDGIIESEEGEEVGIPEDNPLDGYNINKVNFYLKDKQTRDTISECIVIGTSEDEIEIEYF